MIAGVAVAAYLVWTVVLNIRQYHRCQQLAGTRPPLNSAEFTQRLVETGVEQGVAQFVWDQIHYYYIEPLTPYPIDRPVSELKVDPEDLWDIVPLFEKQFARRWGGKWIGPDDPTLIEFALGLMASTSEN